MIGLAWITLDDLAKTLPKLHKSISMLVPSGWNEQVEKMYWVDGFGKFFYYDGCEVKDCQIRKSDLKVWADSSAGRAQRWQC